MYLLSKNSNTKKKKVISILFFLFFFFKFFFKMCTLFKKIETRVLKWLKLISKWKKKPGSFNKDREKLKRKIYKGIPNSLRGTF
jgi:hypothetical protein